MKCRIEDGVKKLQRHKKPQEEWTILIRDHHVGYIGWEEYLEHRKQLEANVAGRLGEAGGAARGGAGLLGGLLRCGRCGRKLTVQYSGSTGRVPRYSCQGGRVHRGSAECQSMGALRVDEAVAAAVLEAIQPVGIEGALAAMRAEGQQEDEKRKALVLALEKATYEARRAERQYHAVDPDNRLVAGELESRWNQTLQTVSQLQSRLDSLGETPQPLSQSQRDRLFALARDLPSVWNHSDASMELKKRILRTVIEEILIDRIEKQYLLKVHWQGGVHTELQVPYNGPGKHRRITDVKARDLIEELSKVCDDQAIAATLNRLGYRTGVGHTWRVHSVHSTRYYYRLANYRNSKDWLTVEQAAKELGVSHTVVRRLIREKMLPASQVVPTTPWIIKRSDLALPALTADVKAVRKGRQLRRTDRTQKELPFE